MDIEVRSDKPFLSDDEDGDTELFVRSYNKTLPNGNRTSIHVDKQITKHSRRKRRVFLAVTVLAAVVLLVITSTIYSTRRDTPGLANFTEATKQLAQAPAKPHIFFIVGDDIGWNDVGWRNPDMKTPNLDKLAKDGVKLNHYYTYPTCSPSRAAFLTGYYSHRLGLQHRVIEEHQSKHIPLNVPLISEKLRDLGYATHAVGKWHLGHCNWNYTATHRGFDSFFGYRFATEDYYTHLERGFYELWENDEPFFDKNKTYSTDLFAERALGIINAHVEEKSPKPLYMYLAFQAIHGPTQETPKDYRVFTPKNINENVRKVTTHTLYAMDVAIGKIVRLLKEGGIYDNSLIIYTSDNGGAVANGGNNQPLRGGKFTLWEGGARVAAMVHGAMIQNPGRSFDGLFHATDWFPTLLTAVGSPWKHDIAPSYDGIDQWETIKTGGTSLRSRRDEIVYSIDPRGSAIRVGDYKLILGDPIGNVWERRVGKGAGSCIYSPDLSFSATHCEVNLTSAMLFNVREDESESHDLANVMPEVVKLLTGKLDSERQRRVPPQSERNYMKEMKPFIKNNVLYPGWC
ncbi:arylsulfatase J-like [Lineus longissimus]|uniref:arylsulfatase J-like n=1 Tax=Lineus longissimus TaxID=88925 RepID=UPI00315D9339